MDLDAAKRRRFLVDARGEERMRKPDSLAFELHDVCLERRLETVGTRDTGGSLGVRDGGVRMRGCREQEVAALAAQAVTRPLTRSCSDSGRGSG